MIIAWLKRGTELVANVSQLYAVVCDKSAVVVEEEVQKGKCQELYGFGVWIAKWDIKHQEAFQSRRIAQTVKLSNVDVIFKNANRAEESIPVKNGKNGSTTASE
jgi:hypothetical protein